MWYSSKHLIGDISVHETGEECYDWRNTTNGTVPYPWMLKCDMCLIVCPDHTPTYLHLGICESNRKRLTKPPVHSCTRSCVLKVWTFECVHWDWKHIFFTMMVLLGSQRRGDRFNEGIIPTPEWFQNVYLLHISESFRGGEEVGTCLGNLLYHTVM